MRFTPFSFITPTPPPIVIEYLVVAGGGGAHGTFGANNVSGAGGAGGFLSGSLLITGSTNTTVIVGSGGSAQNNGGNSTFLSITATGGGAGGDGDPQTQGNTGGSGGGSGARFIGSGTATYPGGLGTAGQGFNGGISYATTIVARAGAGGGAANTASSAEFGQSVPGPQKAWLDGNLYAGGGVSDTRFITRYTSSGSGGSNNTDGTNPNQGGYGGIIKLRYTGSVQLFTGGTTEVSGGYVWHTFATAGSFTFASI